MPNDEPKLTVFFDGSCPLCRAEIGHYQRQRGADVIDFVDVSSGAAPSVCGVDRSQLMARFHVRETDGRLHSGADAFARVWSRLPAWRWAAALARIPGVTPLLELCYRGFLPLRPTLSRLAARLQSRRRTGQSA